MDSLKQWGTSWDEKNQLQHDKKETEERILRLRNKKRATDKAIRLNEQLS
jgi:hypothetical protein